MTRWHQATVLVAGVVVGYVLAAAMGAPATVEPSGTPAPGERRANPNVPATTDTTMFTTTSKPSTTSTVDRIVTYLVWSTGGLTPELVSGMEAHFDRISIVKGDVVELDSGEGVIPLDALAIDPASHLPFDTNADLRALRPGTVVLGTSSAQVRGVTVGDRLSIDGVSYGVAAIVPDEIVSAAEVVFTIDDPTNPVTTDRFALASTRIARDEFEAIVRAAYDGPAPLRIRTPGETPWLRHGDAVLPQVFIKLALGEFSYTNRVGTDFEQSEGFRESIVSMTIPILGEVTCHVIVGEMLAGAMTQLERDGLEHLVDPDDFGGCWQPRFIRTASGAAAGVSRHAWGAAVDINAAANPFGSLGTQDPRLVAVMKEWGFTWGGDWLSPDPMHFEYGDIQD